MLSKGPWYGLSSTFEAIIILSFDCLKLAVTILTLKSAVPTANKLELGWKQREIMGDVEMVFLEWWLRVLTVQHWDSMLKKPRAIVLQVDPKANFLALGAHLETIIDSLMSILTNIRSHLLSAICFQAKTLLSWLEVMILLSAAQSISLMVCEWSFISWRRVQELTSVNLLIL